MPPKVHFLFRQNTKTNQNHTPSVGFFYIPLWICLFVITVVTIAFDLNDGWTETRLRNCASSADDFHDADNNNELAAVFEGIASDIAETVRLTK